MLRIGSKTRLMIGLAVVFASVCMVFAMLSFLAPIWATPVVVALTGCWIIYFLYRWQTIPPDYSRRLTEIASMINLQPLRNETFLPFGRWAMEPGALMQIVSYTQSNYCDTVLECGSGLSTLLIGTLFQQSQKGHLYSLEEDRDWYELMGKLIVEQGLVPYVTLIYAPLQPYDGPEKEILWYAREVLAVVFQEVSHLDLLVVDGPKSAPTASRFPALPEFERLVDAQTLIILDDVRRSDEQDVIENWKQMFDLEIDILRDSDRGQAFVKLRQSPTNVGQ